MKPIEKVTAELWPGVSVVPVMDPLPGNPEGRQDSDKPEAYATTLTVTANDSCNPHGAKHVCLELTAQDVPCPTLQL